MKKVQTLSFLFFDGSVVYSRIFALDEENFDIASDLDPCTAEVSDVLLKVGPRDATYKALDGSFQSAKAAFIASYKYALKVSVEQELIEVKTDEVGLLTLTQIEAEIDDSNIQVGKI